jgi:hypothetical protein
LLLKDAVFVVDVEDVLVVELKDVLLLALRTCK